MDGGVDVGKWSGVRQGIRRVASQNMVLYNESLQNQTMQQPHSPKFTFKRTSTHT